MPINSPEQLLAIKLQQIQDAETEASRAIQEMQQQVRNPELKQLLDRRMQEGEMVLRDVRQAIPKFQNAQGGQSGQGGMSMQNPAARGIIEETRTFLNQVENPDLKEAVAIGGVQSLEHYCIATWGTVKALAREMGAQDVAQCMERALDSGKRLDTELTRIAESRVNPAAMQQGGQGGFQPQA